MRQARESAGCGLLGRRANLREIAAAAIAAAEPAAAVRRHLRVVSGDSPPSPEVGTDGAPSDGQPTLTLMIGDRLVDLSPQGRIWVVGAGKAGAPMSAAVESIDAIDRRITAGEVIVKRGYLAPTRKVRLHEAGHPVPDAAGVTGAEAVLALLRRVAADDTTYADCASIVRRYHLAGRLPPAVKERLDRGVAGEIAETPKSTDGLFARVHNVIVGNNKAAVDAAAAAANRLGYSATVLTMSLAAEAREAGGELARQALEVQRQHGSAGGRVCLIAGGEPTVTCTGSGKGGRAQELALAAAIELQGSAGIVCCAFGTDGTDGPTDAAGAIADGASVARAAAMGLVAERFLANNDSYTFFASIDDLFITGPTRTNVMDVVLFLIDPAGSRPVARGSRRSTSSAL